MNKAPLLSRSQPRTGSPAKCTALGTVHGHPQARPPSAPLGALALFSNSTENEGLQAGKSDAL